MKHMYILRAAKEYAEKYDGDDSQDIKHDVLNAFFAGVKLGIMLYSSEQVEYKGNKDE